MTNPPSLSGDSSIGNCLEHPVGGPIIRDMLTKAGQDPGVLPPVRRLAIKRLVKMSRGSFTTEMLDDLVRRVEAGRSRRARPPPKPRRSSRRRRPHTGPSYRSGPSRSRRDASLGRR
jgi:hypothetical protein